MEIAEFVIPAWKLFFLSILLLVFGAIYALLLNRTTGPLALKWLADDATEVSVIIGVGFVVVASLLVFPFPLTFLIFAMFAMSGLPLVLRSAYNRHAEKQRGKKDLEQEALLARIKEEQVEGVSNG